MSYDDKKLVTLLESTLNPNLRKQAEDELSLVIPFTDLIYFIDYNSI